ncbi:fumarylacetoacetate hydrolase family protein [Streptomyces coelicoflavus]|uniref:Fumarylacetoacetate hydrolase family protein n=1 Tax=Streptomyces coelicoflavus TaxID=285562 RepID=A0A7K3PL25_9ACTN|nr:fumarylacetoacetate hydrolase family protein [Streptomyces coelicoflavus]NEB10668.1 fumarylacetoacetate hydrolase family protein [Streptomyces coelicoflavus]
MRIGTARLDGRTTTVVDRGEGWHASDTAVLDILTGSEPVISTSGEPAEGSIDFVLPYRPPTIHGIGLNFRDTVTDMGWETPKAPFLFPKLSSSACGPNDDIVVDPRLTTRVDWEAELGVIIGRPAKNVPVAMALSHVAGYVAANDISARDLQANDGQWVRGKGLDTFCPLGPWILTSDELDDPQSVGIRTWVNGDLMQDGSTASMIFSVAELISYCSRFFTLAPGDIILTGTPAGCGDFRTPAIALRPGDLVEIEVDNLGRQHSQVVAPSLTPARHNLASG